MSNKDIYILGIESSCDDTSAAILKNGIVLSNIIANQNIHKKYGGVVPELASRAHLSNIIPVIDAALKESNVKLKQISAIAFTRGPGLMGSLIIGTEFSKGLALSLDIPVIDVNHMQAHILVHFINNSNLKPTFPFLGVTISGGHTQFILVEEHFKMKIIGQTLDDAIGEAFDKCGKKIGLDYPAGPEIDTLAREGNELKYEFPLPKVKNGNISYSGTKTAFINFLHKNKLKNKNFIDDNLNDICASIQKNLIDNLLNKVESLSSENNLKTIVFGGGVSANSYLKARMKNASKTNNWKVYIPKLEYSTDNAAMIGIVGHLKYKDSIESNLSSTPSPRLTF
ncbi:MAG: tRNA (adenosine(37)-N6)-threonylcarbamoyltransferase complex transferase subunit TsaD [Flavobacteriaceae bacterium]|nr:tRNA (adenosine(37)-N6)-threonylcarbamoyltransferase complex transferase subunit TsaD [Flavobacteriaceae bacterium]